jgi:uncharacterized protein (TIGR02466 family)
VGDVQQAMQSFRPATSVQLVRESYFPTLIYYWDVPIGKVLNASIRPAIYAWRESEPEGIVRSNAKEAGSWHSTVDMAGRAEFAQLAEIIVASAARIYSELGYDPAFEPNLANMWANINPRHGYNRGHIHPNTLWSGVYYVQAPQGCGRIIFREPRPQAQMVMPAYREGTRKPEAWSEVYFEAIEGRIILFPAWLQHEVEPNMSPLEPPDGDRISIAFNLHQKRRDAPSQPESSSE